jgi:hypothetical protein
MLLLALIAMFSREGAAGKVRFILGPQSKWVYLIGGIVMLLVTINLAGFI